MKNSKIEWTDHTVNLWHGCTKVGPGCANCYAEKGTKRWGKDLWGPDKPRQVIKSALRTLIKLQTEAEAADEVHMVFINSYSDIFEKSMPVVDTKGEPVMEPDEEGDGEHQLTTGELRRTFLDRVHAFPNLYFQLLTKRPANIIRMIPNGWLFEWPDNVIVGVTVACVADVRPAVSALHRLMSTSKHVTTFLSCEPLLESVADELLRQQFGKCIDWVIVGGESGIKKRPFDVAWAYELQQLCDEEDVSCFVKQIDKVRPVPKDLIEARSWPIELNYYRLHRLRLNYQT